MSDNAMRERAKLPESVTVGLKAALIGVLVLVFGIPIELIKGVLRDREGTKSRAEYEIVEKAGGAAVLGAAYLSLPVEYTERSLNDSGEPVSRRLKRDILVMPTELSIKADTSASIRKRGIHEVPVYSADALLEASFDFGPEDSGLEDPRAVWEESRLVLEIADARSLEEAPVMSLDGKKTDMRASNPALGFLKRAVSAPLPLSPAMPGARARSGRAAILLKLSGAQSISFLSAGERTRVSLSGDWKSPSFSGYRLPNERELSGSGFTASWFSGDLSRPFPRVMPSGPANQSAISETLFGMDFMVPTDVYLQSHRALRYAVLFIFIPFAALFVFEILLKKRIHPLQYLLIGLADSLFYLLLLSLAEHLPFMAAYLIAAGAVTAVLAIYAASALGAAKRALVIVPALVAQYAYLYCALESEDYALLIGAIGLFLIVAATMIGTRRINWYAPRSSAEPKSGRGQESLMRESPEGR